MKHSTVQRTAPNSARIRVVHRGKPFRQPEAVPDRNDDSPSSTAATTDDDLLFSQAEDDWPEALGEITAAIGIADWIDPSTGEPAEESIPHLDDY